MHLMFHLKRKQPHLQVGFDCIFIPLARAGQVPTFLKSFRSVLERGPSAKSFRSCSSFFYCSVLVPFRPVPFRSEQKNGLPVLFRSWRSQLKNGCIPLVLFLIKNVSMPCSVLSNKQLHQRGVGVLISYLMDNCTMDNHTN